jgi:hypothetical protein
MKPTQPVLPAGVLNRREVLASVAAAALGAAAGPATGQNNPPPAAGPSARPIRAFYESLTDGQRRTMCFDWDRRGPSGLPLRLHVTNNWAVSPAAVESFSREQQTLIDAILQSVLAEGWPARLAQQARDDTGQAWTRDRKIAIFGRPGTGQCQCVISGFHLTLRALESAPGQTAFGGAICHGHQPSGFNERVGHPGNIFWYQAQRAHQVYQILNGRQRQQALVARNMPWYEFDGRIDRRIILPDSRLDRPLEPDVRLGGPRATPPGLLVSEMTCDQRCALQRLLEGLLEPYRQAYKDQVLACLRRQGGLERCRLAFYQEHTIGREGDWDNWRLEGPSFVWFFRGVPHVHIWIHVADDPASQVTSHFG